MESDKQKFLEMLTGALGERHLGDEEVQALAERVLVYKRQPRRVEVNQHGIVLDFSARRDDLHSTVTDLLQPADFAFMQLFPPGIILPDEFTLRITRELAMVHADET